MKSSRSGVVRALTGARRPVETTREAAPAPASGALAIGRIASLDDAEDGALVASVRVGAATIAARVDPAIDRAVLETALARGEAVLLVTGDAETTIVGALRTRATPGVDAMDHVELRARSVAIEAETFGVRAENVAVDASDAITLRSRAAFLALRAAGEIESFAERIVSRAEGVHKIVGRMLRLN